MLTENEIYDNIIHVLKHESVKAKMPKCLDGGTGRRTGLKILWYLVTVPVRFRL